MNQTATAFFLIRNADIFPATIQTAENSTAFSATGGNFEYLPNGVKSCMKCAIPHTEKGYEYVMSKIGEVIRLAEKK